VTPTSNNDYRLNATPNGSVAGEINVDWAAPARHSARDWVGLYKAGAGDTTFLSWKYTGDLNAGTMTFVLPAVPGQYEFRFFLNNLYTRACTSNVVTIASAYTVTVDAVSLAASPLTVNWSAPANHSIQDWVGLYKAGAPDTSFLKWQYATTSTSGLMTFNTPATAGVYEFRYFLNNGFVRVATSERFTLGAPAYTLNATPVSSTPGGTISVDWSAMAGHSSVDWVGLYRVGGNDRSFVAWKYTGSSPSGRLTFSAPSSSGQYEFRYYLNDGFTLVGISNMVTVSP
jgi:hypothetical protein